MDAFAYFLQVFVLASIDKKYSYIYNEYLPYFKMPTFKKTFNGMK